MADEQQPPPPPPPPKIPPQQATPQISQPVTQPITFSPAQLAPAAPPIQPSPLNVFNPNPGIIAEAGQRGISPSRFADAAGPISRSGSGYSYMTGRGSKVDVAGTPDKPKPRPAPP